MKSLILDYLVTRQKKRDLIAVGFNAVFKVTIIRDIDLDKRLLSQSLKIRTRRRTIQGLLDSIPLKSALKKSKPHHKSMEVLHISSVVPTAPSSTPKKSRQGPRSITFDSFDMDFISPNVSPISIASTSNSSTKIREIPDLIPLAALLKQPKKAPFNVRRKSVDSMDRYQSTKDVADVVENPDQRGISQRSSLSAPSTPTLFKKGTTTKMILNRIWTADLDRDENRLSFIDQTLLNYPDFGKLRYSGSSEE